jgi:uncharacterized protein with FMN-binding domain
MTALWVLVTSWAVSAAADVIELTNGAKVEGKITARYSKTLTVELAVGERKYTRSFPLDGVRALTIDGKRELITEDPPGISASSLQSAERTREEVEALIDKAGRQAPDWWDNVPLNYPRTLDLSWPPRPPGNWNSQRNVSHYVWDVINPNPGKWREGVRLMHHLLTVNQSRPETTQRTMNNLGRMYHDLLQDYARAAFWWRQAGVDKLDHAPLSAVHLAECYWKLGNRELALELLGEIRPHFAMIKLWADMGELDRALRLADANTKGAVADIACIYAGEACRVAEQYEQALDYYQRLLKLPLTGRGWKRIERNQQRARANIEAIRLYEMLDLSRVPDGTYRAISMGFKGPVHVSVTVQSGRIESVRVTKHEEKQFYSAITDTPKKIIEKQSVKGVDATSSATITSEAIINATAKALASGSR